MNLVVIALGGAVGALARYGLSGAVHRFASPYFPWGTFVVNVAGCLVFGFIAGLTDERLTIDQTTRAFLLVGVLGAFTTFSTFSFETVELLRNGETAAALMNAGGQLMLGMVAMFGGVLVGRAL
jgi:CrcB protein